MEQHSPGDLGERSRVMVTRPRLPEPRSAPRFCVHLAGSCRMRNKRSWVIKSISTKAQH